MPSIFTPKSADLTESFPPPHCHQRWSLQPLHRGFSGKEAAVSACKHTASGGGIYPGDKYRLCWQSFCCRLCPGNGARAWVPLFFPDSRDGWRGSLRSYRQPRGVIKLRLCLVNKHAGRQRGLRRDVEGVSRRPSSRRRWILLAFWFFFFFLLFISRFQLLSKYVIGTRMMRWEQVGAVFLLD